MQRLLLRAIALSIALVCAPVALAPAPTACAQDANRRIVVERFRGPRASRVRDLLVADLREHGWEVLGQSEVERAERRLRRRRRDEVDRTDLARLLQVQAFVSGTVSRERRSWRLTVRVRGDHGDVVSTETWSGRTTGAIAVVGRNGATRLRRALERASGAPPPEPEPPPEPQPPPTEPPPTSEVPEPAPVAAVVDEERPPIDRELPPPEETEEEPEDELPAAPSDQGRFDSFRLAFSGGSLWRSMQAIATVYAVRRGQPAADPTTALYDEERGYQSAGIGHAELGVEAEFYPGALGDQTFPWLGALVSFRHSVGLTSFGCRRTAAECSGAGQIEIGTAQLDLQAGLRVRYRFGSRRGDFELFFEGLYGMSTFALDTVALQEIDLDAIIPPADHQYVGVGGGFQVALVPDALTVALRADYRIGVLIGTETREIWGVRTEPANGFLTSAEIRHDATWLAEGAFAALRFEYFQFQTNYRGQVGCAVAGGCPEVPPDQHYTDDNLWEPWPIDANGRVVGGISDTVVDHYVRWGVYLGYAFR